MPPPPINWRTKPEPRRQRPQDNSSFGASQQPNDGLVPIYVDPSRLRDIEAALRYLGLPPLSNRGMDGADHTTFQQDNVDHPTRTQFERLDSSVVTQPEYHADAGPIWRDSLEELSTVSDLSASFSRLSTSTSSASVSRLSTLTSSFQAPSGSFPVRDSPVVQSRSESPRKILKKYYVITIGKCTGVFWDEWDRVSSLIKRVPGARYKGFSTRNEAVEYYLDAKNKGLVRVVRDPGDDALFGPIRDAMQ